jgi:hypothetical protein
MAPSRGTRASMFRSLEIVWRVADLHQSAQPSARERRLRKKRAPRQAAIAASGSPKAVAGHLGEALAGTPATGRRRRSMASRTAPRETGWSRARSRSNTHLPTTSYLAIGFSVSRRRAARPRYVLSGTPAAAGATARTTVGGCRRVVADHMGAAKKRTRRTRHRVGRRPERNSQTADIAREIGEGVTEIGSPRIRSEVAADSVEPAPDAWARFERAVKVVAKSPPQHKTKTKGSFQNAKGGETRENPELINAFRKVLSARPQIPFLLHLETASTHPQLPRKANWRSSDCWFLLGPIVASCFALFHGALEFVGGIAGRACTQRRTILSKGSALPPE